MSGTPAIRHIIPRCLACLCGLFACVAVKAWIVHLNASTAALYMLLVVLTAAARWGLVESIFTSLSGVAIFNFFFLPPVGTFTITDPENWAALGAFLITGITASQLSANARRRAQEASRRGNEISRLYELSRALLMDEGQDATRQSVLRTGQVLNIGDIAFFDATSGETFGALDASRVTLTDLEQVAESGSERSVGGFIVRPVRMGARVIGSLAIPSGSLSPEMSESVSSLLAINHERAIALSRAATAEAARRNEEFKSHLLDGLAHDLKTPLTAIRTCVTRLIAIPPRTEEVRQELLSIIDQESLHLQASITEAIELARIESSSLSLERVTVDAASLLTWVLERVHEEDRARYSIAVPPGTSVKVDPDLFSRAFLQILENAKKYAPPDSSIEIEARSADGLAQFAVLDRGPGFSPDEIERVFDKFYRGRRASGKVEGTGMGLAIAKGIIEAHGGKIRAANRPGGGAAVTLTLPQ